jgi:hypothetical protein
MLVPFLVIGILGYISMGEFLETLDLGLFPMRPALAGQTDYLMQCGCCFIMVSVILANICRIIALKVHFFDMINKEITWKRNV